MASRHVLQRELSPAQVGIDEVAGNATTTGSWIESAGYSQATVHVKYTQSGGHTPTNVTFNIDVSHDGSTAYPLQAASVSSGVATLSDLQYSKATGGASKNFLVDLPLNYESFRIKSLAVGTGASTDTLSVTVRLGVL